MAKKMEKLAEEIHELSDIEKLRLVDGSLKSWTNPKELDKPEKEWDKPDPEIDRVWAVEARKRWAAYRAGRVPTVSYESVMAKHRGS